MSPPALDPVLARLDRARVERVTPGWQLSVRWRDARGAWQALDHEGGALTYDNNTALVSPSTRYDLASVTKALVALTAMRLRERGGLDIDAPLASFLPEAQGAPAGDQTLRALLSHRAELPAWLPMYRALTPREAERGDGRASVLARCLAAPLEPNDRSARYSDLGYILLGAALEAHTGRPLGELVGEHVNGPLGLANGERFSYAPVARPSPETEAAPTELCPWRGRLIVGQVHDENAYALGGVAGHAGLFGGARALATVGERALRSLLEGEAQWLARDTMEEMTRPLPKGSHRLGWDGRSDESSSAGRLMSAATFGHLGFTGTSLWCDPRAAVAVALLTNRVHPTRESVGIKALRVDVHEGVMRALGT